MNSMMEYKGYRARIEYDDVEKTFNGEVWGINDSLSFEGNSVSKLTKAFHDCIENYIDFCKQCGKTPEKEFKGVFNIRINPDAHKKAALEAEQEGITMNQFVAQAIDARLEKKN